ncbi:FecR family protein [Massilia sp. DJPM01]|uniref:FecR family protein n=1 Tax=Massilia sp. DJPM01 TaxID=3024404 RepID=UPI00259E4713|nr:FecR family protein [Massilia sp. DJPM01]MDM5178174.1 FecR family protein [Massilia sp. DJPM01]
MSVAFAASCAALPHAVAGEAGRIVFVTGEVQVASRAAVLDSAVQEGDELTTGAQGYVYMKTVDGGFLILRPNSKARIIAYKVDVANPANTRVKLELLSGVARSISGQGVKLSRQNYRFNTPVAAIGVRGTDFIVSTDQQTSRIAVVSGGVVVSGFAGACRPEGGGPCEGAASRELFAGQPGMLLQVERGQNIPKLLNSPASNPDKVVPPRSDEPVGHAATTVPATPGTAVNLDAQKDSSKQIAKAAVANNANNNNNNNGNNNNGNNGNSGVLPEPIVVVPVPVPEVPKGPEVIWGRWERIANTPPDPAVIERLSNPDYDQGYVLGAYAVRRQLVNKLVLPTEGTASFALVSGEATLQRATGDALGATIGDASLKVDFGKKTFTTSMMVYSPETQMKVTGVGDVFPKGDLYNQAVSNSLIRGYLSGDKGTAATFIFKSRNDPNLTAEGITVWAR